VLVALRLRGAATRHWRIDVWDTGIGIAEDEQAHVFEEFYQVGNPERDRANGLGLGLAIVRRLADLMDLSLTLDSVPERGSRFALEIPATTRPIPQRGESRRPGSLAGVVVAVLEDDREVRQGMQALLSHWGCVACDGADAREIGERLREIGVQAPDAVVADYRLRNDRSGLAEVAALWHAWGVEVPALLVTGDSAPEAIAALHASRHDWLSKPVSAARLRSWLQAVAVARRTTQTLSEAT
jgi:two-component system, sensor histidine kinase